MRGLKLDLMPIFEGLLQVKIKRGRLFLYVTFLSLLGIAVYFFGKPVLIWSKHPGCSSLISMSYDEEFVRTLWYSSKNLMSESDFLNAVEKSNSSNRPLDVEYFTEALNVDWNEYNINPLRVRLKLLGSQVNLRAFNLNQVSGFSYLYLRSAIVLHPPKKHAEFPTVFVECDGGGRIERFEPN